MKDKKNLYLHIVLTALLWLTGIVTSFSQDYIFDTEIINVEDGLPHRMVYDIIQDRKGFIWVNTQGAISRYDGYKFKTYNASFLNIAESNAVTLAVDTHNRLWYWEKNLNSSNSGVIDTVKDSIYNMETISNGLFTSKEVLYIGNSMQGSNDILIATRNGIVYKYNGNFEEIYRFPKSFNIHPVCKGNPDGSYWITYKTKAFNIKNGKVLKMIDTGNSRKIRNIITSYPKLVVELDYPFLGYLKLENNAFAPFFIAPHPPEDIKWLLQLHQDYTCYAIENTVLIRDRHGELIYSFNMPSLGDQLIVNARLQDRQNILWVATENGLLKFIAKKNPFKILLPRNGMRGIFKDKETLWVGGGSIYDAPDFIKTEQEYLPPEGYDAMSFYKDLQNHLWIGTQSSKIVEYIPEQDTYIDYDFNLEGYAFHLPFQNPVTQNYWIGTNNGLFHFDPSNKKITPLFLPITSKGLIIRQFHQNTQGIWIASNRGISLMDTEREYILKHYTTTDGLPTNSINHIHEDKNGVFWLGTKDAGLVRWDIKNNHFQQYTSEDELSNNKIYAVYEDENETLWLPSDYGLMAFDKSTQTTKVYLPKDGIAHEEFNSFSHFQDKNGTMYFGGLNGITKFHPSTFREKTSATSPLYTTRIRVLENDAETFKDRTDAYVSSKKINLNPKDRILEVDLTLLDYEQSDANQYAYKLDGKQEQWIYTRDNKISIINPPYGTYNLIIKARGASGIWSEKPLTIPMYVKRPFYKQWWFILMIILFVIIAIFIAMQWRTRKLKKDHRHLENEIQKRTWQIETDKKIIEQDKQLIEQQAEDLKALDKTKSRFFANITHEFRTPLTLIKGPIEQMMANPPSPTTLKKRLSGMQKNTDNLLKLINQLLDLSKLESKQMKVVISYNDITHYTKELVHRFEPLANHKRLHLEFTTTTTQWKTYFDTDKWSKILYNLLSNAIKFTSEGGFIKVHLRQLRKAEQKYIQLQVVDTGIGIKPEKLEHIFNRFYQADASATRLQGGTGIGLALVKELATLQNGTVTVNSTVGKGTEFTVTLPITPTLVDKPIVMEDILLPTVGEEIPIENKQITSNATHQKEKLQLLIIEDNTEMRRYIGSCIDTSIYTILEAANGEEGIEKAQEVVPDLIISDVMMPKKNGFEVVETIRKHIVTSHIPLILLTAKASLESRLKGLERGADAYLTKPFSSQELSLRIEKLIEIRQLLQQRYQVAIPPKTNPIFKKEDVFISKLRDHINENISDPNLNVNSLTDFFPMGKQQLYRKLKALKNTTVVNYIQSIRLEKAMELLKEGELNLTEIAYKTGFSSLSYFSRSFKKTYGKAPSEIQ